MHVLEKYALNTGLKISTPEVMDEYTPNIQSNFILIDSSVDNPNDIYPYFEDVSAILRDHIISNNLNLKILNNYNERGREISNCDISFSLSVKQLSYMLKRASLVICLDNLTLQLAGVRNKKIVSLFGSRYSQNGKAFFGDKENQIALEGNVKPEFEAHDASKRIKEIKPEEIAKAACDLLGIEFDYPYETLHIGEMYSEESGGLESVPNQLIPPPPQDQHALVFRMDLLFSEDSLAQQLSMGICVPYTNKRIDLDLLANYRPNIPYVIYRIEEDDDPTFISDLARMGIRVVLISYLNEEDIRDKKLHYMEHGLIKFMTHNEDFIKKHKNEENLYYKSVRGLLSEGKIYAHEAAWKNDLPINHRFEPTLAKNIEDISKDLEGLYILKKLD